MTVGEAYRVLELEPGAGEEAVREARKTLAKVWHPDRHASDPALQAKAERKLAQINAAFEALRGAGYPPAPPRALPAHDASPYAPGNARPAYVATPKVPDAPAIELVPRRRVRLWVVVVFAVALAVGAYLAVSQLADGGRATVATRDEPRSIAPPRPSAPDPSPVPVAPPDAAAMPADAGDPPSTYRPPATQLTFGLGASEAAVIAAQGQPTRREQDIWHFGRSTVAFDHRGKVAGYSDDDDVLNVALVATDAAVAAEAKRRGTFAMGASRDEVIGAQGTPRRIVVENASETWYFGTQGSSVGFAGIGGVTAYHDVNHELRLELDP